MTTKKCAVCNRWAVPPPNESRARSCVAIATDARGEKLPTPPGRVNQSSLKCEECAVDPGGVHHGFCSRR